MTPGTGLIGLDLMGFIYDHEKRATRWVQDRSEELMQKMTITFDTGAAISGIEKKKGKSFGYEVKQDSQTSTNYKTATGQAVKDEGQVSPMVLNELGAQKRLNFRIEPVTKPLASRAKVVKAWNRVILDEDESYIQNEVTGDITPLRIEQDVFVFDVWVIPGSQAAEDKAHDGRDLAPVESAPPLTNEVDRPGFPRRVQWP